MLAWLNQFPLFPAYFNLGDTVESVLANGLEDLDIDDLNIENIEVEHGVQVSVVE